MKKIHSAFALAQAFLLELMKLTGALWGFFPVYIDASIWNSTYILCNHQKENLQSLKTSNEIHLTKYNPLQLNLRYFQSRGQTVITELLRGQNRSSILSLDS